MPQLDQIDVQSFVSDFLAEAPASRDGSEERGARAAASSETKPAADDQLFRQMKNDYESRLIEKDAEIRRLSLTVENVRRALGPAGAPDSPAGGSSSAAALWKGKLGSGLAGRIFALFVEHPSKDFTRSQIALGVGSSAKSGHFDNEMGRLTRNSLVVRDGSQYRLNPNL